MQASGPPRCSTSTLHRPPGPGDLQRELPLRKYLDTKREGPLTACHQEPPGRRDLPRCLGGGMT
jgi:hypothetical protein